MSDIVLRAEDIRMCIALSLRKLVVQGGRPLEKQRSAGKHLSDMT